jgi:tetratricopeptide (TPR) repeat protein
VTDSADRPRRTDAGRSAGGGAGPRAGAFGKHENEPGEELPRWVVEALTRVTAPERVRPALSALEAAASAFEEGLFDVAYREASRAKELSPRDATVRELIGLAAYRVGEWDVALRELRTYRRLAGAGEHVPIELDCLRALARLTELDDLWSQVDGLDLGPAVAVECVVVYASALIDQSRIEEAREAIEQVDPRETDADHRLDLTYVEARVAASAGDAGKARILRNAIVEVDPSFPGIRELDAAIETN